MPPLPALPPLPDLGALLGLLTNVAGQGNWFVGSTIGAPGGSVSIGLPGS